MLEIRQGENRSRSFMNASEGSSEILNECVHIFSEELVQLEDNAFFAVSQNELVEGEHFFMEPEFNGLAVGTSSFDTFSLEKCFNVEGLSAVEYGYIKTNDDALASNLIEGEKPDNGLLDRKLEEATEELFDGTSSLPDICEEYLLDVDYIPSTECYGDSVDLDHHSTGSNGIIPSAEKIELPATSMPMLEVSAQNPSFLDKVTIKELNGTFTNVFGRETAVTDPQWLKNRISFGLQNLDVYGNGLKFANRSAASNSNDSEGAMIFSTCNGSSRREDNPLNDVFKFKTKPRVRNVKKGKHASYDYLKTFSSEVSEVLIGFTDLREESVLVREKRSRRPTQRYINDSVEHSFVYQRERLKCYDEVSESKVLPKGPSELQHFQKKSDSTAVVFGKEPIKGGCIPVPFDLSVVQGRPKKRVKKKRNYESEIEDSRLLHSSVDPGMDLYSSESEVGISEDDCIIRSKKPKGKGWRKRHTLWSLPEVLKLVEGVSEYGVGKWTEIKRLLFSSYAHRTSVDLKDKWRNLLRASRKGLHGKKRCITCLYCIRGVNLEYGSCKLRKKTLRGYCTCFHRNCRGDPIRKNASHSIPQHILRRVRELSVMHPHPRVHSKIKDSQTVSSAPTVSVLPTHDNLLPLSTTVGV